MKKRKSNYVGLNQIKGIVKIYRVLKKTQEKYIDFTAIKIKSLESDFVAVVNPDKKGSFSFKSVPAGNYIVESELVINKTRYAGVNQIQVTNNIRPEKIQITIKKSDLIIKQSKNG